MGAWACMLNPRIRSLAGRLATSQCLRSMDRRPCACTAPLWCSWPFASAACSGDVVERQRRSALDVLGDGLQLQAVVQTPAVSDLFLQPLCICNSLSLLWLETVYRACAGAQVQPWAWPPDGCR